MGKGGKHRNSGLTNHNFHPLTRLIPSRSKIFPLHVQFLLGGKIYVLENSGMLLNNKIKPGEWSHKAQPTEKIMDPTKFQRVPNLLVIALAKKQIQPLDIAVYMVLANHLGNNECAWPGNKRIASAVGADARTVQRSIKRLSGANIISRGGKADRGTIKTSLTMRVEDGAVLGRLPATSQSLETKPIAFCPSKPPDNKRNGLEILESWNNSNRVTEYLPGAEEGQETEPFDVPF